MSQSFLISPLDAGRIELRHVGQQRRVCAESLLAYAGADDRRRGQVANELMSLKQEMGLL